MLYIIQGTPIPLQRPRYYNDRVYDSQRHAKNIVTFELQRQHQGPLLSIPLLVELKYYFGFPKSMSEKKRQSLLGQPLKSRPDLDNLIKLTLDCSNNVLWTDDALIVGITASKLYGEPRTEMIITPYKPE